MRRMKWKFRLSSIVCRTLLTQTCSLYAFAKFDSMIDIHGGKHNIECNCKLQVHREKMRNDQSKSTFTFCWIRNFSRDSSPLSYRVQSEKEKCGMWNVRRAKRDETGIEYVVHARIETTVSSCSPHFVHMKMMTVLAERENERARVETWKWQRHPISSTTMRNFFRSYRRCGITFSNEIMLLSFCQHFDNMSWNLWGLSSVK